MVLLCEDEEHQRLAWHAFRRLGRQNRVLRILVCPSGRGAAESWVRQHYAEEVKLHRRKASSQEGLALVVMIDADQQTVEYRHQQFADGLAEAGLEGRSSLERIIIWVPKRHVETWVADLLQGGANEEDDYKNAMRDADYRLAAERFVERCRNSASRPPGSLNSMSRAIEETTARMPK